MWNNHSYINQGRLTQIIKANQHEYLEQSKINLTDQIDLRKKQNCIKDANNMTEQRATYFTDL